MVTLLTMYAPQANSPTTTTTAALSASGTTVTVLSGTSLPDAPNLLVLGGESESAETVRMTEKSGNTLTIVRGVEGQAKAWPSGTTIARNFTAKDLADVQENLTTLNAGKAESSSVPTAGTANPLMDGTATPGYGTSYARHNHVHPKDTSKQDKITASGLLKGNGNGGVSAATEADLSSAGAVTWNDDGFADITAGSIVKMAPTGSEATFTAAVAGTDFALPSAIPSPSSSSPLMDGTASAGTGTDYARGNHRHPADTNKQNTITATGLLKGGGSGSVTAAQAGVDFVAPEALESYIPAYEKDAPGGIPTLTSDALLKPTQGFSKPVILASTRNLAASDYGCLLYTTAATSAARTLTIPAGMLVGAEIEILRQGSGSVIIKAANNVTVNSQTGTDVNIQITERYKSVVLKHVTLNVWNAQGAIE